MEVSPAHSCRCLKHTAGVGGGGRYDSDIGCFWIGAWREWVNMDHVQADEISLTWPQLRAETSFPALLNVLNCHAINLTIPLVRISVEKCVQRLKTTLQNQLDIFYSTP